MKVRCPTCRKETDYSADNPSRPFCSDRCKILDLGAWADEKYRVPLSEQESSAVNEKSDESPGKDELN